MAITVFHELAIPVSDCIRTGIEADWYVRIKGTDPYYLLNHTNHLGDLMHYPDAEFYFSTELEACDAAFRFYEQHGKTYPHMGYLVSLQADYLKTLTKQQDDSQVMEFI